MPNPPAAQHCARFPPTARLRQQIEFDRVFATPKKSIDRYWVVLAVAQLGNGINGRARLGLVISKKRIKLSVQRNRMKRLIRESFRQRQLELAPLDIIVLARDKTAVTNPAILRASLDQHWKRLQR